ncbi:hypothetical protein C1H46_022144 [Malus baccata]|uniref:Uncharacterized protein n=1 Tax=Malus baccata TaxID=106549 RepID=A0A540M190_MALBA|nr:hypothetical protein C1H46_022144 [Malus baccata]
MLFQTALSPTSTRQTRSNPSSSTPSPPAKKSSSSASPVPSPPLAGKCITNEPRVGKVACLGVNLLLVNLKHVPGFIEKAEELKSKGVEKILCLSGITSHLTVFSVEFSLLAAIWHRI